ncbi:tumor necrosis factor receptor superfamily member 19L [Eublepharis macularius]|uniref:Tumor necrosis factor receptor superfamily member 19L n=1 Tax=Eublepharis macularius TaxID=481883 RepID=A0AA97KSY7_EUBMA|nr:tumor necrosis factor receptor superfamily member 19L [Eublepharis macularius]
MRFFSPSADFSGCLRGWAVAGRRILRKDLRAASFCVCFDIRSLKMTRHLHFSSVFSFFAVFCCYHAQAHMCGEQEYRSTKGPCLPCSGCPPGEEPDRKCGFGEGLGMICKPCSANAFSSGYGLELCSLHTHCEDKKRAWISPGTPAADSMCGDCMPGYYSPEGETDPRTTCLPCSSAPKGMPGCPGSRKWLTRLARNAEASHRRDDKTLLNGTRDGKPEENATQYAVLAIVPVFCVMGLLGILFCNLLMKKGYHCTAQKDEEGAKAERNGNSSAYRIEDANEDTIGVLVRLITEKKENAVVLEEMLKEYHSKQLMQPVYKPANKLQLLPQIPHICRHQHHLHTVQGLATRSGPTCTRCSQRKWPEVLLSPEAAAVAASSAGVKPAKPGSKVGRPGEITILSVGRFRVARIPEQKPSPSEVKTISESAGAESTEPPYACLVPEQKPILGNSVKPKWLTTGDGQQEDSPLIVRLGETNLVI